MKRQGNKADAEWEDVCAMLDEAQCTALYARGNCTWSSEKGICYNTMEHVNDALETVDFTLRVNNLDYASLYAKQNAKVLITLTNTLKELISSEAGAKVKPKHVDLSLLAGSVIVEVSIRPLTSISATSVQSNLGNNSHMLSRMADGIEKVDGISAVRTGTISASVIITPAVRPALSTAAAPAPGPVPTTEGSATTEGSDINVGIFVAAGTGSAMIIGISCLLCACWGRCRASRKAQSHAGQPSECNPNTSKDFVHGVVVATPVKATVVEGVVVDSVVEAV